jgi:exopolyphosphatase/guanosine-5'-triphosphate,3'-diphosphate pyrophosphatase
VLLRLACLIHRSRAPGDGPRPAVSVQGDTLRLSFPDGWLDGHPLTRQELAEEAERLTSSGIGLECG